jgi:DNA-binding transcriptional regulator PaaX
MADGLRRLASSATPTTSSASASARAFPAAAQLVPELRMIVVAGPRIDPATLPAADGLEVRPLVEDLYRHLAACDLAVVQGGLTTAWS